MLQIALEKPGSFVRRTVTEPMSTADGDEALVRIHRIGVCGTDLHAFAGRQPFFSYPRVLGHELGVEVLEAPANERGIVPGSRCAVEPYLNCGSCIACRRGKSNCCASLRVLGVHTDGGMQPLFRVPVHKLHPSAKLSLDQLALVETLAIGAHAVERAAPTADEIALVIGLGPIGLGVMQSLLARQVKVVAMDMSTDRLTFARQTLGVRATVDARAGEVDAQLRAVNAGELPTVVFDATGHPQSMMSTFELTAPGGRIVYVGLFQGQVTFDDPNFHRRELTLLASRNATPATFTDLIDRIERGLIDTTPWITRRVELAQVPEVFATLPTTPGLIKAMIDVPAD